MDNDDDSATDSDKSSSKSYCRLTVVDPTLPPENDIVSICNEDGSREGSSPARSSTTALIQRDIESEFQSYVGIDFSNVEIPPDEF